jgi:hypothetical protein
MDPTEIRLSGMDRINLSPDKGPAAGYCEYGNEPSGSIKVGKFLSSRAIGGFSRT